jgi:hypothetical protein
MGHCPREAERMRGSRGQGGDEDARGCIASSMKHCTALMASSVAAQPRCSPHHAPRASAAALFFHSPASPPPIPRP